MCMLENKNECGCVCVTFTILENWDQIRAGLMREANI